MQIKLNNGLILEVGAGGIVKGLEPKTGIETITIPFYSDKNLMELDEIFSNPQNTSKMYLIEGEDAVESIRNYTVLAQTTYNKISKVFAFVLTKESIESKLVELVIDKIALENKVKELETKTTDLYTISDYQDSCIVELYEQKTV